MWSNCWELRPGFSLDIDFDGRTREWHNIVNFTGLSKSCVEIINVEFSVIV